MAVTQVVVSSSVMVRFKKKDKVEPSQARPAKIVVEAGKIDIISEDNKFPTIHLKAANVTKPKPPAGKTTTWMCLDIIQNVDAKFNYVNIQLKTASETEEVYNMLMLAWTPEKRGLFQVDDAFSNDPVHIPPPKKKKSAAPTVGVGRSAQGAISVHPEGSPHPAFNNDIRKLPATQNRKATMNDTLKFLFDDYGVSNTSKEQPIVQVRSNPAPMQRPVVIEREQEEERENVPASSKPSNGLPPFYGNTTPNNPISRPTLSNSIDQSGTEDSLGPSVSRLSRSAVKVNPPDDLTMSPYDQYDFNSNDQNDNRESPKEKSVMSKACSNLFDSQFKKISKLSPDKPTSSFKSIFSDDKKERENVPVNMKSPSPSIPWLAELRARREAAAAESAAAAAALEAAAAEEAAASAAISRESDRDEPAMKEIKKEFNLMAEEVYRLEEKERLDLIHVVKTIVKETVKRKMEE